MKKKNVGLKVRPFRHTFQVPSKQTPTARTVLGPKAQGQTPPYKDPGPPPAGSPGYKIVEPRIRRPKTRTTPYRGKNQ